MYRFDCVYLRKKPKSPKGLGALGSITLPIYDLLLIVRSVKKISAASRRQKRG